MPKGSKLVIPAATVLLVLMLSAISYCAGAGVDLGVYGPTYSIQEKDFRDVLTKRFARVFSDKNRHHAFEEYKQRVENFDLHIPDTTEEKTWEVDTSFDVTEDILDQDGNVIVPAGTYNILDYVPATRRTYVFINAKQEDQLKFAKRMVQKQGAMVILTAGNAFQLKKQGFPKIYQASDALLSRFGIKSVPAVIQLKDHRLIVREVSLNASAS